ncbi:glycosyl hydrolase [Sphingobacterium griseoflavum]|uniref:Glycosyl hydrolase family 2 n=1 Tax=Sphingobacterium griseoflavum TaxID=1474952 RepID=A0ABQ3HYR0_9SPHI|nr:glycosyl hydrolase [Sphingobacterium griseoflavum]GHE48203.1 glycosyl hydrolase family 2 [Sphingobacterium griseoflavum]
MAKICLIILYFSLILHAAFAQEGWPTVTKEMKPWTRWWWMGSAVDKPNLARELQSFDDVGIGGVEVTPIYGAKGYESRNIPFLSSNWMDMLAFTVGEANRLGLGVDMNLGTGWPFGGPQVSEKDAATKFFLDTISLKSGDELHFPLIPKDGKQTFAQLQAIRAFTSNGEEMNLDRYIGKKKAQWSAGEDVCVIALFSGRTKQKVKRAAPGGEGYTLDHLGATSVNHYLGSFAQAFKGRQIPIHSFFNDSYEVYGANWTDSFLEEFRKRKNYKLEDRLLDFAGKGNDKDREGRVKADYREVVSAVLRDNFLLPFTNFAHQQGALSRNQAHGSPGNLIDLYASTDIAECETFGSSFFNIPHLRRDSADIRNVDPDPMMFKFASSATHTHGKKYTSSETFTWLTEHFRTSLSQTKPEVEQLFLAGVNHVFYHGTTYSPKDIAFPGWLFYASVNFTSHNPLWAHMDGLNRYITRVQSILQSTQADNELLVYWPIYDIWHETDGPFKTLSVHHVDRWLHPTAFYKQSVALQRAGYSFDFVTDAILEQSTVHHEGVVTAANARPYKAVIVPESNYFSEKTFAKLLDLAKEGATVIFQGLPQDVPGFHQVVERRRQLSDLRATLKFSADEENQYTTYGKGKIYLTKDMHSALETEQIFAERIVRSGLQFSRRVGQEKIYYYFVNHSDKMIDDLFRLNTSAASYTLLDPQTGKIFELPTQKGHVRLQIPAGYAWLVALSDKPVAATTYRYINKQTELPVFNQPWKVTFVDGGPILPKPRTLKQLSFWTAWNDDDASRFSGIANYETTIQLDKQLNKSYLLTLGTVGESARVFVNDKEVGVLWAHPFQLEIGDVLQQGRNTIRIEVANLMANRVRDLDKRKISWRNYHEINFVNIDYKTFDASSWQMMDSGLEGPVKLFLY